MLTELLMSDQPSPEEVDRRESSLGDDALFALARRYDARGERPPPGSGRGVDDSSPVIAVDHQACILCDRCIRACNDVQGNEVIGRTGKGHGTRIAFDLDVPMGESSCVSCGECAAACPTGALVDRPIGPALRPRSELEPVDSVCPYCGVGCTLTYHVDRAKNEIVFAEGRESPASQGRLCVKGRYGWDYASHAQRLRRPLIRRAEAYPKGALSRDVRGDSDGRRKPGGLVDESEILPAFREASWEEALDLVARRLSEIRDREGGDALAGFGSAKCSNEEAYLFQKLIRTAFHHNNVDHCTRLCHASSVAALMENVGSGAVTATFNEIENADVAIVIGSNPTENHPVAATYFKQFVKRGGELIVMDPRGMGLKRHATEMLQFRPGTDVAMLNAIMHVIVEEKLYDRNYVEGFTEGFFQLRDHLRGFSPEKMAEHCGIDAGTLRRVARKFAGAKAGMIFWGMGISQHIHGTDNSRCLISLALLAGHVGRPGAGLHPLRGQNNVQGASDAGLIPMVLPDYQPVKSESVRDLFRGIWGAEIDDEPGLTVVEMVDAMYRGQIRGMYIMGENPAMSDPDVEHAREALSHLDHLVVQDIFLTETANFADVILPASAWPEKTGTVTNTNRQVQMGRKALDAPGEAKEDWWITCELGKRLGLNWSYEHPSEVFSEMKMSMQSLKNITWGRLEAEGAVTYPSLGPEDPGQAVVFSDGFPRAGGRARFTPAQVTPPAESPDHEYPMILTTGRQLEHWHTGSMTRRATVLDWAEPEAHASLHPRTLRRMGLKAGDRIRVETRRGGIDIAARADRAIAEDMVFIPFAYVEAAANVLTNPQLDPYGKIPEFKYSACRVARAGESAVPAE